VSEVSFFFDSKNGFTQPKTGMAARKHAEELFGVADVVTVVEVERFLHQRRFNSRRHPLSGSEGSVARLVHKLMGRISPGRTNGKNNHPKIIDKPYIK
jgi:hypothetical protein